MSLQRVDSIECSITQKKKYCFVRFQMAFEIRMVFNNLFTISHINPSSTFKFRLSFLNTRDPLEYFFVESANIVSISMRISFLSDKTRITLSINFH